MKLLFINTIYASAMVGGAQRSVQFIAEAMLALGHECSVICAGETTEEKANVNGVSVYRVGLANFYWPYNGERQPAWKRLGWHIRDSSNPAMARRVAEILDLEKPDLVHTNVLACFSTTVWAQAQARHIPIVHTLRDYYLTCPNSGMFRHGRNCVDQCRTCHLFAIPRRSSSKRVEAVVGNSEFMLQLHLRLGYFEQTPLRRVVHNAYKLDFPVAPRLAASNPIKLGYLGRVSPNKGVDYILEKLSASEINYHLQIAGEGDAEYVTALRQRYESEKVQFVGVVDARDFFPGIDALIVPSLWHEPLPRVIFEAYAFGVPVLGSDRGGIPEIVAQGQTGFLFDPADGEAFLGAVRQLTANPARFAALSAAALEAAKAFLPENIVSSYQAIYQEAVNHSG